MWLCLILSLAGLMYAVGLQSTVGNVFAVIFGLAAFGSWNSARQRPHR